jgi:hypothetical protein
MQITGEDGLWGTLWTALVGWAGWVSLGTIRTKTNAALLKEIHADVREIRTSLLDKKPD